MTVLSIVGIAAHDHVHHSSLLDKVLEVESLRGVLPFVRSTYSRPSCYHWIMPLLFGCPELQAELLSFGQGIPCRRLCLVSAGTHT